MDLSEPERGAMSINEDSTGWLLPLADGRVAALTTGPREKASEDDDWFEVPPYLLRVVEQISRKVSQGGSPRLRTYALHPDDQEMLDRYTTFTDESGWSRAFAHRDGKFVVNARLREVVGDTGVQMPPIAFDPATAVVMLQLAQIQRSLKRIEERLEKISEQVREVLETLRSADEANVAAWVSMVDEVHQRLGKTGWVTQTDREELSGAQHPMRARHQQTREFLDGVVRKMADPDARAAVAAVNQLEADHVRRALIQEWITLKSLAQLAEIRAAVRAQRGEPPLADEASFVIEAIQHMRARSDRLSGVEVVFDPTFAQRVDAVQQSVIGRLTRQAKMPQISGVRKTHKKRSRDRKATGGAAAGLSGVAAAPMAAAAAAAVAAPSAGAILVHLKAKRDRRQQESSTTAVESLKTLFATEDLPQLDQPAERIKLTTDP